MPGAIQVIGEDVWDLVLPTSSVPLRLRMQIKEAFAETRVLSAAANRADSQAEGDGTPNGGIKLKNLFGASIAPVCSSR